MSDGSPERDAPVSTPGPDDWPIEGLMRGRADVERWAREQGILDSDQMIVVEVRAVRLRNAAAVFGVRPQAAVILHHNGNGWMD